jgi:anti-anti-sigma factor
VDIGTAPELTAVLDAAIRDSRGAFILDLCDVEFLDSSGVNVVLRTLAMLGRSDRALAVVCPHRPVRQVFEVAGIADLLALFDSRDQVAASLRPAS